MTAETTGPQDALARLRSGYLASMNDRIDAIRGARRSLMTSGLEGLTGLRRLVHNLAQAWLGPLGPSLPDDC